MLFSPSLWLCVTAAKKILYRSQGLNIVSLECWWEIHTEVQITSDDCELAWRESYKVDASFLKRGGVITSRYMVGSKERQYFQPA